MRRFPALNIPQSVSPNASLVGGDMHKAPLKRRSKWLFQIYWLNKFEIGFYELF